MAAMALVQCGKRVPVRVRLQVFVPPEDVGELRRVLMQFAAAEGFRVDDVGKDFPPIRELGNRKAFHFELSRADTIGITITDLVEEGTFLIHMREEKASGDFERIASRLEAVLRAHWPNIAPYTEP